MEETSSEIQSILHSFEQKLAQTEDECLKLKEREAELLHQINILKSENMELRLKTERVSFMFTRQDKG